MPFLVTEKGGGFGEEPAHLCFKLWRLSAGASSHLPLSLAVSPSPRLPFLSCLNVFFF